MAAFFDANAKAGLTSSPFLLTLFLPPLRGFSANDGQRGRLPIIHNTGD